MPATRLFLDWLPAYKNVERHFAFKNYGELGLQFAGSAQPLS